MAARRLAPLIAAALAAVTLASGAGAADPHALAMQQTIKKTLQAQLKKDVPGLTVTKVKCTAAKDGHTGTCRADFAYGSKTGFYMLKVRTPATGKPSYTSTSVTCFEASSGARVACNG